MQTRNTWLPLAVAAVALLLAPQGGLGHSNGTTTSQRSAWTFGDGIVQWAQAHSIGCNDTSACLDVGSMITCKIAMTYHPQYTDYGAVVGSASQSVSCYETGPMSCPGEVVEVFAFLTTSLSNSNQSHSTHSGIDPPGSIMLPCDSGNQPQ